MLAPVSMPHCLPLFDDYAMMRRRYFILLRFFTDAFIYYIFFAARHLMLYFRRFCLRMRASFI